MIARWSEFRAEFFLLIRGLAEAHLFRVITMILVVMLLSAAVLWEIETVVEGHDTFDSLFDAVWWAIVTMTTVGYGDITPQGVFGKFAAMVVILGGVAMFSVFTATVSSVFVATKIREGKGLQEIYYKDHMVICGWHPGAERVLEALQALSAGKARLVFVNDLPPAQIEELLERFKKMQPKFVRGDYSHATILRRAGLHQAASAILLPDMTSGATAAQIDQRTTLAALTVRDVNPKARVYAYALETDSIPHMRRGGVDRVVVRDAYQGYLLACHALAPGIPEVVDELLNYERGHRFDRVRLPDHLVGKTVRDASSWLLDQYKGTLVGVLKEERVIDVEDILSDDFSSIDAFIKRKFEEAGRNADELARTRVKITPDPDGLIEKGTVAVIIQPADLKKTS